MELFKKLLKKLVIPLTLALIIFMGNGDFIASAATESDNSDDKGQIELTLEEAVKRALENSDLLEVAENNVEKARIEKEDTWDLYNGFLINTHIPGTDMYAAVSSDLDPSGLVFKTLYNWKVAKKDYEKKIASTIANAYKNYAAVLSAKDEVEAEKLNVQQLEREVFIAEAKWQVGMEVKSNVIGKQAELARARAELENAYSNLNKAYDSLNDLTGMPENSKPELTSTVEYKPFEVENLDYTVDKIADNSPEVWKAKETVELIKDTYGMTNSYDVDKQNLKNARLGVDITHDQLCLAIKQIYYGIKDLEAAYNSAQDGLAAAEEGLRSAQMLYEVGMATQNDVIKAEAAVAAAKAALNKLAWQHEIAVRTFYEPWAWMDAGATSGNRADNTASM